MNDEEFFDLSALPDDISLLKGADFFSLVENLLGELYKNILKVQNIDSVFLFLNINNIFEIFDYDPPDLIDLKSKCYLQNPNGDTLLKPGIQRGFECLTKLFRKKFEHVQTQDTTNSDISPHSLTDIIESHPILQSLVRFYQSQNGDQAETQFLSSLINNVTNNLSNYSSKSRYRYNDFIKNFSLCLYVLDGKPAYEFVRQNLPSAIPTLTTMQTMITSNENSIVEGNFRFQQLQKFLQPYHQKFVFAVGDYTGVVRKLNYCAKTNSFIDFASPLLNGTPIPSYFQTDDFDQLQTWFTLTEKANLLNIHRVQPVP
ncbi:unnamed protein product [Didymodactylos carnosus]|uniref:Uncharacterized protein n=1 Tax=Didymodactylos carnosus TaxID=1234261 RepID=A0A815CUP5_9BILA|nr:unnamed protein product [Didymodactylos carnosus]CAF4092561.1 unnamed protein product [Didymodactylos carnosus]